MGGRHYSEDSRDEKNEYTMEPTPLNDVTSSRQDVLHGNDFKIQRSASSPDSRGGYAPLPNTSRSMTQFTSSTSRVSPGSSSINRSPVTPSSSSNLGAVFGEPVKFGAWEDRPRPSHQGAEVYKHVDMVN